MKLKLCRLTTYVSGGKVYRGKDVYDFADDVAQKLLSKRDAEKQPVFVVVHEAPKQESAPTPEPAPSVSEGEVTEGEAAAPRRYGRRARAAVTGEMDTAEGIQV